MSGRRELKNRSWLPSNSSLTWMRLNYYPAVHGIDPRRPQITMTTIQIDENQTGAGGQGPLLAPLRACEQCHRKKTKCDMARPVCGLCRRTGGVCEFPSKRRPPARPVKRQKTDTAPTEGNLIWLLNLIGNADASQLQLPNPPAEQTGQQLRSTPGENIDSTTPDGPSVYATESTLGPTGLDAPAEVSAPRPEPSLSNMSGVEPVSCELAMDLVETFFAHIQPWLPALHKPRFMARCAWDFQKGPDALQHLSLEMKLLLNSMFALSARFSTSPILASLPPLNRDASFVTAARLNYAALRTRTEPTLTYLQGCILLAFHSYTADLNSQAWILTGVCVRLAYELGLSEIDDESIGGRPETDQVTVEEMRRTWWLIWELDTFGSMITRRPFAVDRHHFTVNLPIADADWFDQSNILSSPLVTSLDHSWTSLRESENQNPRAWFLIANHLLSLLYKHVHRRHPSPKTNLTHFETAVNCFRLSLPASFRILSRPPAFEADNFANWNWIMGTHLMLTSVYSTLDSLHANERDRPSPLSVPSQSSDGGTRLRSVALSQLIARWPVEYMTAAHPFFICALLPTDAETAGPNPLHLAKSSLEGIDQMVELILMCFSEKWKLAGQILGTILPPLNCSVQMVSNLFI